MASTSRSAAAAVTLAEVCVLLKQVHESLASLTAAFEGLVTGLSLMQDEAGSPPIVSPTTTLSATTTTASPTSNMATAAAAAAQSSNAPVLNMSPEEIAAHLARPVLTPDEVAAQLADSSATVFYLVSRGLEPGIYDNPTDATSQTTGVSNAQVVRINNKWSAIARYSDFYEHGSIKRIV